MIILSSSFSQELLISTLLLRVPMYIYFGIVVDQRTKQRFPQTDQYCTCYLPSWPTPTTCVTISSYSLPIQATTPGYMARSVAGCGYSSPVTPRMSNTSSPQTIPTSPREQSMPLSLISWLAASSPLIVHCLYVHAQKSRACLSARGWFL